uniref:DEK-C domain-containing protein n=1 Tax=Schistocephalus solidus TaxID=70667 RepID=A0A0X3Q0D3_SCHSO
MPDKVESFADTLVGKPPPQSSNGLQNTTTNYDSSGNDPSTSESDIQKPSEISDQENRSEHEEDEEDEEEREEKEDHDPKKKSDNVSATPGGRPSHRPRKTVERLSESLNKRFEQQQANKDKQQDLVTTQLQGRGCPLGEIPLIEASIKKSKPADLKLLHFAAFGRPGSVHEIRTNLRRFRGFVFTKSAPEYTKREELLNKRPAILIREALRVLNLEVSGSRSQLVSRLIDFLCSPSADSVKYKGKLHKKPRRPRNSSSGDKKTKRVSGAPRGRKRKATTDDEEEEDSHGDSSESDEDKAGKKGQKATGVAKEKQAEEDDSSEGDQVSDDDDEVYSPGNSKTKKSRKKATPKHAKAKLPSSASEKKAAVKVNKSAPKKRRTVVESDDEEEDELPLAKMVPEKQAFPSDEELKSRVVELLKTSNLQETSMKVVRNSIAAQYEGIDLSSKKQYINEVIKEYLSSSL